MFKLTYTRKMLIFVVLTLLVSSQMGLGLSVTRPVKGQENKIITGLYTPTVDGFLDKNQPPGFLGEWGDALKINTDLLTTENETVPVELSIKYVVNSLYIGFEYPALLDAVALQIDLNHDNKLSEGDLQIILINGILKVRMYMVSPPALCTPIEELLTIDDLQTIQEVMNIGSIAMELSKGKTQVEMAFSDRKLIELLEKHDIPADYYELYELLGMGEINFGLLTKTRQGVLSVSSTSFPTFPSHPNDFLECVWVHEYLPYDFEFDINIPPPYEANVGIDHIEVTQTIQTENNEMPLVLDKTSLARVFIDNPSGSAQNVNVKLTGMVMYGVLFGYSFSSKKAPPGDYTIYPEQLLYQTLGTLQQEFTAPANPLDREEYSHSANFELPSSWVDNRVLLLRAEVERNGYWTDPDSSNDVLSETFAFYKTHDMNIYYIRINENTAANPVLASDSFVNKNIGNLSVAYPMANPTFTELDWSTIGVFNGDSDALKAELTDVAGELILGYILILAFGGDPSFPLPDQVFGFCTTGAGSSTPSWYNDGTCYAAWGGPGATHDEMVMSHEVNHNIGPGDGDEQWGRHVSGPGYGCNAPGPDATWQGLYNDGEIHEPGWYPGATEMVASNEMDVMTYLSCCCAGNPYPTQWISDYRWERLFDRLRDWSPGVPDPSLAPYLSPAFLKKIRQTSNTFDSTNTDESIRIIQGAIHLDGSGELDPSFSYPISGGSASAFFGAWPEPEDPSAYLKVHYQNGSSLTLPISIAFTSHEGENGTRAGFTRIVPDNGEITLIQLLDDSDQVLDQLNATGYVVNDASISGPSEIKRDTLTEIQWNLDITNSTNIYTQLQYSHNGDVWYPLGQPTLGSSTEVVFSTLPGGDSASIRLFVTDGVQTEIIEGYSFSLAKLPPILDLSSNIPSQIVAGSKLSLYSTARDPETGPIDNDSLTWKITKDSSVVEETTGAFLVTQLTETGTYQITVTAVDPDGQETSEIIDLEVVSPSYLAEETWEEFTSDLEATRGSFPFPALDYPILSLFSVLLIVFVITRYYQRKKKA
ncbi:MAG: hypothetical protein GF308_12545 [Candidatus Heimdallarchaeota archaeon]|nr:hypothetical protein [Candidatus Heimdallarchaeota archaeon]